MPTVYKTRDVREALRSALVAYRYVACNTKKSFGDVSEVLRGMPTIRARGVPSPSVVARWRDEKSILCTAHNMNDLCECLVFRETPHATEHYGLASACATDAIVLPIPPTWRFHELRADSEAPMRAHVENLALAILSTPEDPRVLHCALACDTMPAGLTVCTYWDLVNATKMSPQALMGAIRSLQRAGWISYYKRLLLVRLLQVPDTREVMGGALFTALENAYDMDGLKLLPVRGATEIWHLRALERKGLASLRSTLLLFSVRSEVMPNMGIIEGRHRFHRQMFEQMRQLVEEAPWFP